MAWYTEIGDMNDVVLSTRVRFARNINSLPFPSKATDALANEVIEKVCSVLPQYSCKRFGKDPDKELLSLMEMHFVSPEFANSARRRALITGENDHLQIMLCEEDHIRIQGIVAGFAPEEAFRYAAMADDIICKGLDIAYNDKYGYLTACPTNLGNAMRVSAMLCLPSLTYAKKIEGYADALNKMGITIRGIYGEGSKASACLYQISNRSSLGIKDTEIIKLMSDVIKKLVEAERNARSTLFTNGRIYWTDKIARALGVLQSCYVISSDEFCQHLPLLKLGISLNLINGLCHEKMTEMLIAIKPATLTMSKEGLENDTDRDVARAAIMREMLKNVSVSYQ